VLEPFDRFLDSREKSLRTDVPFAFEPLYSFGESADPAVDRTRFETHVACGVGVQHESAQWISTRKGLRRWARDDSRWERVTRNDLPMGSLRPRGGPITFYRSHRCLLRGDGGQGCAGVSALACPAR